MSIRDVRRWRFLLLIVGLVVLLGGAGAVIAQVGVTEGEPGLEVYVPEDELVPGERNQLELQVQNNGTIESGTDTSRVLTAEAVTVSLNDTGPFAPKTNTTAIGTIPQGETVPVVKELAVPEDVEPGTYTIDGELEYSHASEVGPDGEVLSQEFDDEEFSVTVTVPDDARFEIGSIESDVQPGASDEVTVELRNVGTETATDTEVELIGSGGVTLGEGTEEAWLGDVEPGESTNVTVDAALTERAAGGEKPIEAIFTYTDVDGVEQVSSPVRGTLHAADRISVSIDDFDTDLAVGFDGTVTGVLRNDGPRQLADAVVTIATESESLVVADPRYAIPDLEPNETAPFRFPVDVSPEADAGDRQLELAVEHRGGDRSTVTTDPIRERATVSPGASIGIDNFADNLTVGFDGSITGTVVNDGDRDLEDAVVTVTTESDSLTVTDPTYAIPDLAVGERTTFEFLTTVSPEADPGPRQVQIAVDHRGGDRSTLTTDTVNELVEVGEKQRFSITNVSDTLEVGYDGEVRGVIENEGPRTIDDGILIVTPQSDSLFVSDTRLALPSLESGETAEFVYPTDVSGQADAGPRQMQFQVEFEGGDGRTVTSDTMSERVVVEPRTGEFRIEPVNATLEAGSTDELTFEITNQRHETLSQIDAMVHTRSPLSSPGDEDFVTELGPGESTIVSFEIGVADDARERTYRLEMDFEYDTERGDTELSDVTRVPVDVVAPTDADTGILDRVGLPLLGVVIVGGAVGLAVWWRRR